MAEQKPNKGMADQKPNKGMADQKPNSSPEITEIIEVSSDTDDDDQVPQEDVMQQNQVPDDVLQPQASIPEAAESSRPANELVLQVQVSQPNARQNEDQLSAHTISINIGVPLIEQTADQPDERHGAEVMDAQFPQANLRRSNEYHGGEVTEAQTDQKSDQSEDRPTSSDVESVDNSEQNIGKDEPSGASDSVDLSTDDSDKKRQTFWRNWRGPRPKIIVIGSGISGLAAAKLLHLAGLDIQVLEARPLHGGRIQTIEFPAQEGFNAVKIDKGASFIHGCTNNYSLNPLFPLSGILKVRTVKSFGSSGWEDPTATSWIGRNGKSIELKLVSRMYYAQESIHLLGLQKLIEKSDFEIPDEAPVDKVEDKTDHDTDDGDDQAAAQAETLRQSGSPLQQPHNVDEQPTTSAADMMETDEDAQSSTARIRSTNSRSRKRKSRKTKKQPPAKKRKTKDDHFKVNCKNGVFDDDSPDHRTILRKELSQQSMNYLFEAGLKELRNRSKFKMSDLEEAVLQAIIARLYYYVVPATRLNCVEYFDFNSASLGKKAKYNTKDRWKPGDIQFLNKEIRRLQEESKAEEPKILTKLETDDEEYHEDRLICDTFSIITDFLAENLNIQFEKVCERIDYTDSGVTINCIGDETFEAQNCIVTVPIGVMKSYANDPFHLKFNPPLPSKKMNAINRLGIPMIGAKTHNKVILRFNKVFWNPMSPSICNAEFAVNITNYHKFGKENILVVHIWANSLLSTFDFTDAEMCENICRMLKTMYPKSYTNDVKVINMAVTRWTEERFSRCSYTGQEVESEREDFIQLETPLPNEEKPIVMFAGEGTIHPDDALQCTHGAFLTGYREANRILKYYGVPELPPEKDIAFFLTGTANTS